MLTTVKTAKPSTRTRLRAWNPPAPPMTDFAAKTRCTISELVIRETSVLNLVYLGVAPLALVREQPLGSAAVLDHVDRADGVLGQNLELGALSLHLGVGRRRHERRLRRRRRERLVEGERVAPIDLLRCRCERRRGRQRERCETGEALKSAAACARRNRTCSRRTSLSRGRNPLEIKVPLRPGVCFFGGIAAPESL